MDKTPFYAKKFTDTILKESENIKLSLETDPVTFDKTLLDPMPCPRIKHTETSTAVDASIQQLSMWSRQLLQLEDGLGISKPPAKARGLDTAGKRKTFLHRTLSTPQLNQTKAKLQQPIKVPKMPNKVDIELTKQMLSDYCKKYRADRSCRTFKIDKELISGVCSDLDTLTHLIADVTVEYEKLPVVKANSENKELSNWLNDINQVKQLIK